MPPIKASWFDRNAVVIFFLAGVVVVSFLLAWGVQLAGRKIASSLATRSQRKSGAAVAPTIDSVTQAEAEQILGRVAAGDAGAAEQVLFQSANWTGKTRRTPKAQQMIASALNSHDLHMREAALQAVLAMDGVPTNQAGLDRLERAVGNSQQRAWALWTLGALGNRGVDPAHTTKIIELYLSDSEVTVRADAVNGLSLIGTDETIPLLLDRFRNDPSPVVQERAACALAEAGMYTHPQRMVAAASLVGWLDDSGLTSPQRTWMLHALRDISGQNLGSDSAVWRQWYDSAR
jgi:HEAT repeat protein